MERTIGRLAVAVATAAWLAWAPPSVAQDWQTLIQQALDQNTDLVIDEQPIGQALDYIGQTTGVPIEIAPEVVDLLPYGAETVVSATIRNTPLREGLGGFLRPIGLRCVVRESRLRAEPAPALARLGRRATWAELELLDALASEPWSGRLAETLPIAFEGRLLGRPDPLGTLREQAARAGAGNALDVLENACESLGWAWSPREGHIVVTDAADFNRARLAEMGSFDYQARRLVQVLIDLGSAAGVVVRFEPGVVADLPAQTREHFTLRAENISFEQAFELIAGATGLAYEVRGDGVWLGGPDTSGASATARPAAGADPYVMSISVPTGDGGATVRLLVRQSEVPREVLELRRERIDEVVSQLADSLMP